MISCFYHPGYALPLPSGHPFPMEKFPEVFAFLNRDKVPHTLHLVEPASPDALLRVHTPTYLARIKEGRLRPYDRNRLGLPHHPLLLDRCRLETAGTMGAVHAAWREGVACNLAGGTHHAMANRGLGYCILNDVVVAIRDWRQSVPHGVVMVVDTDAHQGNGTHALLRDDPLSFTYSIHGGKNYPAEKVPGGCDVGLPRWVSGAAYLEALSATLPAYLEQAEPDLVIWISGADPHENDRFGQMKLTTADLQERDTFVVRLCQKWDLPLAVLYGGGYNRDPMGTALLHYQTLRTVFKLYSE
jgi:acetoin utilization deacetylase AcuC-like enzyme